jgi:hypothetical protein
MIEKASMHREVGHFSGAVSVISTPHVVLSMESLFLQLT